MTSSWIDPFTRFGWSEVFIPFVSHYRASGMAFGIVGLYLGIAVGISTWLRTQIGYKWWRRFHVLTLVIFVFATLHGIITGTDSTSLWMIGMYSVCSALVGTLFVMRLRKSAAQKNKRHAASTNNVRQVIGTGTR